jgi:zinc protease
MQASKMPGLDMLSTNISASRLSLSAVGLRYHIVRPSKRVPSMMRRFLPGLATVMLVMPLGVSLAQVPQPVQPAAAQSPAGQPARSAAPLPAADPSVLIKPVDIPYERFTLPNGLTTIVHTDRKAPVVAVSVWYHVGSKDEPPGKTGFAHLFEHLMYNGSENADGEFFVPLEQVGATDYNGTTWFDRTNYFESVPTPALELALFLESDRMGHLLGAVTQEKLDNQRGVVQNEKRQGDNQPYGLVEYAQLAALFPPGHPYRHSTIGSMQDLDAASLEDVRQWFRTHYGPNNAVLVLAGDIDAATARPLVEKWFGAIPAGPEPKPVEAPVPVHETTRRETMHDRVATARLYRNWVAPGMTHEDSTLLATAAAVLGGLSTARLENALVRDEKLAVAVSGSLQPFEKVSLIELTVDVRPGVDPRTVEQRMDQIVHQFLVDGPTEDEVQRVVTGALSGTIRGLEKVGGFGGKAVTLAEGQLYADDPEFFKQELHRLAAATPEAVRDAARRWMGKGDYKLWVLPGEREKDGPAERAQREVASTATQQPELAAADGGKPVTSKPRSYRQAPADATAAAAPQTAKDAEPDRSTFPPVGDISSLDFPTVERDRLPNGVEISFVRRATVPVVNMSLVFDAGNAADDRTKPGTQALLLSLLDEGTTSRDSLAIATEKERLGASINATASMDRTRVTLSALTPNLGSSIELLADIVRNPAFEPDEIERLRQTVLARIAAEKTQPMALALRELPPLIFGQAHPYGVPFTGSGTEAGVRSVTRDDLVAFHERWLRPDNLRIFVTGDTTLAEVRPLLEKAFGHWQPPARDKGAKSFAAVEPPASSRILLIDRPGSPQSLILAGSPLAVRGTDNPVALEAANDILGGTFTSRLNADLREEKGWAYGVRTQVYGVREQMPFFFMAPVQTDKTGPSVAAALEEMRAYTGQAGTRPDELERMVNNNVRSLPGSFETAADVLGGLEAIALYDRPGNWYETLADRYRALTAQVVDGAIRRYVQPDRLTWVVVGDAATVRPQLQALGLPLEVRSAAASAVPASAAR